MLRASVHEQMAIQMALATVTHHSFQVGTAHDALRSQKPVTSAGGMRPPPLVEGQSQERIQRHTVELMIDVSTHVQIVDAPVPQVEDHALESQTNKRTNEQTNKQTSNKQQTTNNKQQTKLYGDDPEPSTPQPELFSLHEEEPGGSRPDRIPTLSGPQERVLPRTVQQIVDAVPSLPTLDDPAPQMVEQLHAHA